jgi:hypothetical protein
MPKFKVTIDLPHWEAEVDAETYEDALAKADDLFTNDIISDPIQYVKIMEVKCTDQTSSKTN